MGKEGIERWRFEVRAKRSSVREKLGRRVKGERGRVVEVKLEGTSFARVERSSTGGVSVLFDQVEVASYCDHHKRK